MKNTIELTRIELPAVEGQRGRKPCEWRIGDFVIPKAMTCIECGHDKSTNKDQFLKLIIKTGLSPEKFVNKYICRSCRFSMKANNEPVKIGHYKETVESEALGKPVFDIKKRLSFNCGVQLGLVVKRRPVVFYALKNEFETTGFSFWTLNHATEVYDLTNNLCVQHTKVNLTEQDKRNSMEKFSNVKTMFNLEDIHAVIYHILNGGLEFK